MDMALIVNTIRSTLDCTIYSPNGLPSIGEGHVLPSDLQDFYQLCGGANLFDHAEYSVSIVPPQDVVLANSVIFGGASAEVFEAIKNDISWSWYIIGKGGSSEYITIDCDSQRLGQCYDSFWDLHPGDSPIIAVSFTDLLLRLLASQGQDWYWGRPDFKSLGSPYD